MQESQVISNSAMIVAGEAVGAWTWKTFGKDIVTSVSGTLKSKWAEVAWQEQSEKYRQKLLSCSSTTKLFGNPKEIDLEKIYTEVYVLDRISAYQRFAIEDLKRGEGLNLKKEPLIEVVRNHTRLFVLGRPGAGKTTFLKAVIRHCCNSSINKIPIFVSLKSWVDSHHTLIDFILSEFDICKFPDAGEFVNTILVDGRAIVLFDGLDEVTPLQGKRDEVIKSVVVFCRKYDKCQVIVTCRTAATDYSFEDFSYFEIAEFSKSQQIFFIEKWYGDHETERNSILSCWNDNRNTGIVDLEFIRK